jgi:hypothetical protein
MDTDDLATGVAAVTGINDRSTARLLTAIRHASGKRRETSGQ